jgi:hypothetical protein
MQLPPAISFSRCAILAMIPSVNKDSMIINPNLRNLFSAPDPLYGIHRTDVASREITKGSAQMLIHSNT